MCGNCSDKGWVTHGMSDNGEDEIAMCDDCMKYDTDEEALTAHLKSGDVRPHWGSVLTSCEVTA